MTPGGFMVAALGGGLFPAGARSLGRGWVGWEVADLAYRVVVDRDRQSVRLRAFVAHGYLGPAMQAYGGLSVPLDPVGDRIGWPEGSRLGRDHAAAVASLCADVPSFAGSRRELALLMMSQREVRHGDTVAWLPDGGWPGRLAQALVIAVDLDDRACREICGAPG